MCTEPPGKQRARLDSAAVCPSQPRDGGQQQLQVVVVATTLHPSPGFVVLVSGVRDYVHATAGVVPEEDKVSAQELLCQCV